MSIQKTLINQLNKNNATIDTVQEQLNDLQQVKKYMMRRIEEEELTPVQQKKMELYEFIYNQSIGGKWQEEELIDIIKAKATCSRPTAILLLNDTKELFTRVLSINKQWELKRQLAVNERLLQKAETANDFKALAMLEKNRIKILELVEDIEEQQEEFKGHTFIISADPSIIGMKPVNPKEMKGLLKQLKDKFKYEDPDNNYEEVEIIE